MKYFKNILWALTIVFIILDIFKVVPNKISYTIIFLSMGTVLLISSLEFRKKHGSTKEFYFTIVFSVIAYIFGLVEIFFL